MKKYTAYQISTIPFNSEILSNTLWKFDLLGLIEEEHSIQVFLPEDSKITKEIIEVEFEGLKKGNLIDSFLIHKEILADKNWNELWEKSREVIRVSEKIVIKPSFKTYNKEKDDIVLTIDPKMSFGTGEHQTTKLVLSLLEEYIEPEMKVLDIGSGTGILSIATIKLGATSAIAIDNDEICYENCSENCHINGVSSAVKILTGEVKNIPDKNFDLIMANIQKNVLLNIGSEIKNRLKTNKKTILSGLLEQDLAEIDRLYSQLGFKIIEKKAMNEWIALVLQLKTS